MTNKSLLDDTVFDNVNVVVEPFAVNSSTVLSVISKLAATSPMNEPNITSDDSGAVLNTIVESESIPYRLWGLLYLVVVEEHH